VTVSFCSREKEITELFQSGHWPAACSSDLRAHVDTCDRCRDFVLVTQAFRLARVESTKSARVNSPGVLWWRAELRRRNAAFEDIGKPITVAQLFALLINLLVAAGFAVAESRHWVRWPSWLSDLPQSRAFHLETLWSFASMKPDWNLMILIPTLGAVALLSGVVLYLAWEKK
jgi:hypothetical protein